MSWQGDISAMGRLADRVGDLARVPSRAAARVSAELGMLIEGEFEEGIDPYGRAWEPLAESTLDRGRSAPPLTDTGAMRESVAVRPMRHAGVAITLDHPAAPHQTGWDGPQGTGPKRAILPDRQMPEAWANVIEDAVTDEFRRAG